MYVHILLDLDSINYNLLGINQLVKTYLVFHLVSEENEDSYPRTSNHHASLLASIFIGRSAYHTVLIIDQKCVLCVTFFKKLVVCDCIFYNILSLFGLFNHSLFWCFYSIFDWLKTQCVSCFDCYWKLLTIAITLHIDSGLKSEKKCNF